MTLASPVVDYREVLGSETPRIRTKRPPGRSRASEVVHFAKEALGVTPMPWQQYALRAGLIWKGGGWASRTVGILVGRQNGKTSLATLRALAGMCLFGERRVIATSQNRDVAMDAWREALDLALDADLGVHPINHTTGREEFWIGAARYKVVSSTRRGPRGQVADLVIADELREYRDWDSWAALEKTRRARASSQLWAFSTEGDVGSVVLAQMAAAGRMTAAAGIDTDAAWMEWSAPPGLSRSDPRAWAAANPALGHLIKPEVIASECRHDKPEVFETEVLCRRVASLNPWLEGGLWEDCADSTSTVPDGAKVIFALHAGDDFRHSSIAVGWRRDDGKVHVETVASWFHTEGPVLSLAAQYLARLCEEWDVVRVVASGGSASEAAARRALGDTDVEFKAMNRADMARAASGVIEAILARQLVHPGDPMTAGHFASISAGARFPTARSEVADIDAAVAIVLAHYAVITTSIEPSQDWLAF